MLYPDFHELVALKNQKAKLLQKSRKAVVTKSTGQHLSLFRGQGIEFDAVREYVPGDDIRNIDWRVTARTGSPHLKLFKEDKERQTLICLDMNASMRFGTKNTFKSVQAARIAALLGWKGLAHNDSVSACLYGDVPEGIRYFSPKRARNAFYRMLKMISEPPSQENQISTAKALERLCKTTSTGCLIYVISDFLDFDDPLETEVMVSNLAKKCDLVFISINDRADQAMYPIGMVAFSKNGSEKSFVNTDNLQGRNAYAKLWNANRKNLEEVTKKYKIPLLSLTTESDVQRELLIGLNAIAKRRRR